MAADPVAAVEGELLRLREMLKWQTRLIEQLQGELRVERAIGDFWAAEAANLEAGRVGGDCVDDIEDWHRRQP